MPERLGLGLIQIDPQRGTGWRAGEITSLQWARSIFFSTSALSSRQGPPTRSAANDWPWCLRRRHQIGHGPDQADVGCQLGQRGQVAEPAFCRHWRANVSTASRSSAGVLGARPLSLFSAVLGLMR